MVIGAPFGSPIGGAFEGVAAKATAADLNDQAREKASSAQINASALSDIPSDQDSIGFFPYVRALAWFLSSTTLADFERPGIPKSVFL